MILNYNKYIVFTKKKQWIYSPLNSLFPSEITYDSPGTFQHRILFKQVSIYVLLICTRAQTEAVTEN